MFLQSRKKSAILKKNKKNNLISTPMQPEQIPVIRVRTKAFTTVTLELFPTEPVTCELIRAVFLQSS